MFAKYAALVSSASEGAVTRPPVSTRASRPAPVRTDRAPGEAVAKARKSVAPVKRAAAKVERGAAKRAGGGRGSAAGRRGKVTVRGRRAR